MAQRRSAASRTKTTAGKKAKTAKPVVKRVKAKAAVKSRSAAKSKPAAKSKIASKSKPAPKRAAAKSAKAPARKAAKPAAAKAAKANTRGAAGTRRQRRAKGRRAPAFERGPNFGAETRDEDYVYERVARDTARSDGETNDTYAPGDLMPGQVGEARAARRDGRRGSRAVSVRPRDSETESVTVESGAPANGGFEEDAGRSRDSGIAATQRSDGEDKPAVKQDYGRPKTGDGKPGE